MNKESENMDHEADRLKLYKKIKKFKSVFIHSENPKAIKTLKEINFCLIQLGISMESLYYLYVRYEYKDLDSAIKLIFKGNIFYNHEFFSKKEYSEILKKKMTQNFENKDDLLNSSNMSMSMNSNFLNSINNSQFNNSNQNINLKKPNLNKHCLICNGLRSAHFNFSNIEDTNSVKILNNSIKLKNPSNLEEGEEFEINQLNIKNNQSNYDINGNHAIINDFLKKKKQLETVDFDNLLINQNSVNRKIIENFSITKLKYKPKTNSCSICYGQSSFYQNICDCKNIICTSCFSNYCFFYITTLLPNTNYSFKNFDDYEKCNKHQFKIKCPFNCGKYIADDQKNAIINNFNNSKRDLVDKYISWDKIKRNIYIIKSNNIYLISCSYVNCNEKVHYNELVSKFVECDKNHQFCAKCKGKWHQDKKCFDYFDSLKFTQSNMVRMCINCGKICHLKRNSFEINCHNCYFKFCFFCFEEPSSDHFSIYNINGCGWKNKNCKYNESKINNELDYDHVEKIEKIKSLTCSEKSLSYLLFFLYKFTLFIIFLFVGCSHEIVKLFIEFIETNEKTKKSEVLNNMKSEKKLISIKNVNDNKFNDDKNEKNNFDKTSNDIVKLFKNEWKYNKFLIYTVVILLLVLGILLQPFYILFKIIEYVIDYYKYSGLKDEDVND